MNRNRLLVVGCSLVVLLAWAVPALAADPPHNFVGAEKCKMCHNTPAKGAQFTKWSESMHSKAYQTLAGEEAKKIAAAKNIADPQNAAECLRCHIAGYGAPAAALTEKYKKEDGVTCEGCHGPGGDYWKMDVMKDKAKAMAAGLVMPNEKTCTGCHNQESPTFKGFDFKTALAKVAHPNPQGAGK
jgi:nitrate/TMAO reductase-like tetraheme cytochrome c subunit